MNIIGSLINCGILAGIVLTCSCSDIFEDDTIDKTLPPLMIDTTNLSFKTDSIVVLYILAYNKIPIESRNIGVTRRFDDSARMNVFKASKILWLRGEDGRDKDKIRLVKDSLHNNYTKRIRSLYFCYRDGICIYHIPPEVRYLTELEEIRITNPRAWMLGVSTVTIPNEICKLQFFQECIFLCKAKVMSPPCLRVKNGDNSNSDYFSFVRIFDKRTD